MKRSFVGIIFSFVFIIFTCSDFTQGVHARSLYDAKTENSRVFIPLVVNSWPVQKDLTYVIDEAETLSLPLSAYGRSAINVSVFRKEAMISIDDRQIVGYLTADGDIALLVRKLDQIVASEIIPGPMSDRMLGDGHQGVNMGYSTDGFIHVILGAHTATHYYYKIAWPDLEIVHSDERELALPSDIISYPQFYNLAGELLLFFRDDDSKTYSLNRYDAVSGKWRPWIVPLITTPDEVDRIYTNGLSIRGSTIAIAYTWRYYPDSSNPDEYVVLNEGWRIVWSNDFGFTWQAFDGASLSLPIHAFSPTISYFVPAGRNLSNQAGSWLGSDQILRVSYFADDAHGIPQVYITEFDLSTREIVTHPPISNNDTDFDLTGRGTLSLPLSRPVVFGLTDRLVTLYRYKNSLYAGWRPTSDETVEWQGMALCTGFLDSYEPIMDFGRAEADDISLYIQGAKQGPNDTNFPSDFDAPVTMLDLSYEAVSTLMPISP